MKRALHFLSMLLLMNSAVAHSSSISAERPGSVVVAHVRLNWMRNFNAGDIHGVLALYADDATIVSEAGTFKGREAIRPWVEASIRQGSKLESIEAIEEKSSGSLAYGTGKSRRWVGKELHLGRYLIVMERIGDRWQIVQHFSMNVKPDGDR